MSIPATACASEPCVLAVDVESDWGHAELRGVEEVLPRFLELLDRHEATATFFVVGELADSVRARLDPGARHEVGSHGLTHRILTDLSADAAWFELAESRRRLEALGYRVEGFRAPFLKTPRELVPMLRRAGYRYDASLGSLFHGLGGRRGRRASPAAEMPRLGTSTLAASVFPFNLTWLRLLHPFGVTLLPPRPRMFSLHLHEFLADRGGWYSLPRPLRRLHSLHCGSTAWQILERLLVRYRGRVTSCRRLLSTIPSSSEPGPPA